MRLLSYNPVSLCSEQDSQLIFLNFSLAATSPAKNCNSFEFPRYKF